MKGPANNATEYAGFVDERNLWIADNDAFSPDPFEMGLQKPLNIAELQKYAFALLTRGELSSPLFTPTAAPISLYFMNITLYSTIHYFCDLCEKLSQKKKNSHHTRSQHSDDRD